MCFSYAAGQYNLVLHTDSSATVAVSNDLYLKSYANYHISHKVYHSDCLEQSLTEISKDICLSTKNTVEHAIEQAKSNLYYKNVSS